VRKFSVRQRKIDDKKKRWVADNVWK